MIYVIGTAASTACRVRETNMTTPTDHPDNALDYVKWEAEKAFREREIVVEERELEAREAEIDLKRKELAASQWSNPLIVAILAASIAAIGGAAVALVNDISNRQIETQTAEDARILEMIKTGNPDRAADNLDFLLHAGLIANAETRTKIQDFLRDRKAGSGPALPVANGTVDAQIDMLSRALEGANRRKSK